MVYFVAALVESVPQADGVKPSRPVTRHRLLVIEKIRQTKNREVIHSGLTTVDKTVKMQKATATMVG